MINPLTPGYGKSGELDNSPLPSPPSTQLNAAGKGTGKSVIKNNDSAMGEMMFFTTNHCSLMNPDLDVFSSHQKQELSKGKQIQT